MKNFRKRVNAFLFITVLASSSLSCSKFLELEPEDKLDISKNYKSVDDANATVIGIYGKFLNLAKSHVLLNELRADLVDITPNSDQYLAQLSTHSATLGNPYIDPRPYYEVILNCNDALANFDKMVQDHRMSVDDYNMRYSDIGALRSWIYLQLGIQYGEVPYITEAPQSVNDLQNLKSYPKITFDELLEKLIDFTSKLPYMEVAAYPASTTATSLVISVDANNTQRLFINKYLLLGDLYLWKEKYEEAATAYKKVLSSEDGNSNISVRYNYYKVGWSEEANYANHIVKYVDNKNQQESALITSVDNGWRSIFGLPTTAGAWNSEWFWGIAYNPTYTKNPFLELCSNQFGKYLIKPSQAAIDNWNSQVQSSGIPYDARGRLSYSTSTGQPVITKLTDNSELLVGGGKWGIYRAASVHLHYAEAANRDGKGKLAYALLNTGISGVFYQGTRDANGGIAPVSTAEQNTMITPYEEPYKFDARTGVPGPWYRNIGIRSRAKLPSWGVEYQTDQIGLENKLIDEAALELAFEGQRWSDLLRIARRRNDPSFLADKIYQKLVKAGNPNASAVREKLMDPKKWYLPFEM